MQLLWQVCLMQLLWSQHFILIVFGVIIGNYLFFSLLCFLLWIMPVFSCFHFELQPHVNPSEIFLCAQSSLLFRYTDFIWHPNSRSAQYFFSFIFLSSNKFLFSSVRLKHMLFDKTNRIRITLDGMQICHLSIVAFAVSHICYFTFHLCSSIYCCSSKVVSSFRLLLCWPVLLFFSKFGDIFDEDHFIETLKQHVRVVKELPVDVLTRFDHIISSIQNMRTKAYSSPNHYMQKVLPELLELGYGKHSPPMIERIWLNIVSFYFLFHSGLCELPHSQIDWHNQFHQISRPWDVLLTTKRWDLLGQ